jgi:hypothetical protein
MPAAGSPCPRCEHGMTKQAEADSTPVRLAVGRPGRCRGNEAGPAVALLLGPQKYTAYRPGEA